MNRNMLPHSYAVKATHEDPTKVTRTCHVQCLLQTIFDALIMSQKFDSEPRTTSVVRLEKESTMAHTQLADPLQRGYDGRRKAVKLQHKKRWRRTTKMQGGRIEVPMNQSAATNRFTGDTQLPATTTIEDLPTEILTMIFTYHFDAFAFDHDMTIFDLMRVSLRWFQAVFGLYWGKDIPTLSREQLLEKLKSMRKAEQYPAIPAKARREGLSKRRGPLDNEYEEDVVVVGTRLQDASSTLFTNIAITNSEVYKNVQHHTTHRAQMLSSVGTGCSRLRETDTISEWAACDEFAAPCAEDEDLLMWSPGKGWLVRKEDKIQSVATSSSSSATLAVNEESTATGQDRLYHHFCDTWPDISIPPRKPASTEPKI